MSRTTRKGNDGASTALYEGYWLGGVVGLRERSLALAKAGLRAGVLECFRQSDPGRDVIDKIAFSWISGGFLDRTAGLAVGAWLKLVVVLLLRGVVGGHGTRASPPYLNYRPASPAVSTTTLL